MEKEKIVWISKKMSFLLRHGAIREGVPISPGGWVEITDLLEYLNKNNRRVAITGEEVRVVVEKNDKQRFTINNGRIRANQGHSIAVNLDLKPREPPPILFHGTSIKFLKPILKSGLKPMNRNHVHLSKDVKTATEVGARHGKPIVLIIAAGTMHDDGFCFYLSENGVWLVDHVPSRYISQ
ncbi:MAG: RNA 2'-phosphotransferase [Promethearchaeota archaeon]